MCVYVCVSFVVCLCVFRFKLSSDLIVSGTIVLGTHKKFVQVIWYKCRLLSFMPSKIPIAEYNAELPSFIPSKMPSTKFARENVEK